MKKINYDYNNNIEELIKIIIKRNKVKNPFDLINEKVKITNAKENYTVKKVLGVEIIPIQNYSKDLDTMATNGYYSNSDNTVNYTKLKQDFNCYDNNLVLLTIN